MNQQTLLVLDYLRDHTFEQLEIEHGVCARPSANLDRISLNYDQCMAKKGDPITEQCRGVVIRPRGWPNKDLQSLCAANPFAKDAQWRKMQCADGVELLAWPMCRFYNDGDVAAAPINWKHAKILEKLDGTMIVLYWDPLYGMWCTATRAVPEADLPIKTNDLLIGSMTFSQLFWMAVDLTIESVNVDLDRVDVFNKLDFNNTYVFELTSPHNKVVVQYNAPRVTLIAVRNIVTGLEIDPLTLDTPFNDLIPAAKEWSILPENLKDHVDSLAAADCEGAVVIDTSTHPFKRRKVKNKNWMLASMFKDTIDTSPRGAMRFVVDGTWDDAQAEVAPEVRAEFDRMARGYRLYLSAIDANARAWKEAAASSQHPRKAYALLVQAAKEQERSPAYFPMLDGKAETAAEWYFGLIATKSLHDTIVDDLLKKVSMYAPVGVSRVF